MFSRLFRRKPTTIALMPGQVLIRVTESFLKQLMTRTEDGQKMTVIMGPRLADGTYDPGIMVEDDGKVVMDRIRPRAKRGLAVVKDGRIIQ